MFPIFATILATIISTTYAVHQLNVLSNILFDDYGGRHPQIRIGRDNLPFIIWESDSKGAIGVAHCNDDIYCNTFSTFYLDTNETHPHINYSHANQVYMRISPYTQYPQILYSLTNAPNTPSGLKYYLRFVTCLNYNCTEHHIKDVLNESLHNNGNNFYVYFIYTNTDESEAKIFISYNRDPYGLYLVKCMDITCDKNTNYGPYSIFATNSNTGWYNTMYILSNSIMLFMYYNNDTFSVNYAFYDYNELKILQRAQINDNVHGGWLSTTDVSDSMEEILIGHVYVDIVSGYYMYGLCNVSVDPILTVHCDDTVIDTDISDSVNDYHLFVYPDIVMDPLFNKYPITAYFHVNSLKIAQCDNLLCDTNTYVQTLANGSFGYGRDAFIEWYNEYNLLYISFLDFNQDGKDKKARLLICQPSISNKHQ